MERHAKRAVDNSSKRRQVTEKLHKAIEKSKRKGDRHVRDQKKGGFGRKSKADDIEDVEITSEEDNIEENNKPQADDFFIQEEEDNENEDEKKTRLAKELLNKISQNIEDDK